MPTVADVESIAKTLGSILAGKPQHHGALTVIPILAPMQAEPEWLTLAEAGDRVRITEVDDEGSVPELRVANLGDLPLLLLDGEQLVGAKQNRILNMTVLVAAQSKVKWVSPNGEGDRRNVRRPGRCRLIAVDELGVDLVCEGLAAPLVHMMEDTFDRGGLSLGTFWGAEFENND